MNGGGTIYYTLSPGQQAVHWVAPVLLQHAATGLGHHHHHGWRKQGRGGPPSSS